MVLDYSLKPIDTIIIGKGGDFFGDSAIASVTIHNTAKTLDKLIQEHDNYKNLSYKQKCLWILAEVWNDNVLNIKI